MLLALDTEQFFKKIQLGGDVSQQVICSCPSNAEVWQSVIAEVSSLYVS
jgi:hypothetical protein